MKEKKSYDPIDPTKDFENIALKTCYRMSKESVTALLWPGRRPGTWMAAENDHEGTILVGMSGEIRLGEAWEYFINHIFRI